MGCSRQNHTIHMLRVNLRHQEPKRAHKEKREKDKGPIHRGGRFGWRALFSKKYRFGLPRTGDDDSRILHRYEGPTAMPAKGEAHIPREVMPDKELYDDLRVRKILSRSREHQTEYVNPPPGLRAELRKRLGVRKGDEIHITTGFITNTGRFPVKEIFVRVQGRIRGVGFFTAEPSRIGAKLYAQLASYTMHAIEAGRIAVGQYEVEPFFQNRKQFMETLRNFIKKEGKIQGTEILVPSAKIDKLGQRMEELSELVEEELRRLGEVLVEGKKVIVK